MRRGGLPRRLRGGMTVWFLLAWTTLILPCMALTVEIPWLLGARLTVAHAARAGLQAAFQRCGDFERYQTAATGAAPVQGTACVQREAEALYRRMLAQQSTAYSRQATLTVAPHFVPGQPRRYRLEGCLPFTPRLMPTWSFPDRVCVREVARLEFRDRP